jgi:acyl-CoA synthetase (AMP-forming)/AMP-acid ligase II
MNFLGVVPSDATALVDSAVGERTTYADLVRSGRAIAASFGTAKRLVFLVARNDAFTATTYWGALDAGHAVALIDGHAPLETTAALVDTYRPAWLAGAVGLGDRLAGLDVGIDSTRQVAGGELIRTVAATRSDLHPDLGLLLTTSGTTGSQKLARLSVRNVEANADAIAQCLGLTSGERPLAVLPIHYSFGLSVVNSHWRVGATVVLTRDGVLQRQLWETFDGERCTSLAGVPYTYQMLERIGFRQMALPSLTSLQQAGGALDLRLAGLYRDHMARRNGRFFVMYGQTEATARIAVVPPDRLVDKPGSAGLPIPGGQFRIVVDRSAGPIGRDTGVNETATVGELVYQGPNVMLGYASTVADLALGDELHGVLRTGDIGYIDEEGFAFLVGRSKRIAKVFGQRVNLDEVESVVRESGPAAVVGGTDTLWAFCAFGTTDEVERLKRSIAARLRIHHSGLQFRRVDVIPTTGSGKIDYHQVEEWVE